MVAYINKNQKKSKKTKLKNTMSSKKGNEAKDRAYDHYRWAERYSRYGDEAKAKAHMRRAVHYGKAAFGTGPGAESAGHVDQGTKKQKVEGTWQPTESRRYGANVPIEGAEGETQKTDIVFILGPLNESAVKKIEGSIEQSTRDGNKVEVYIQAFSEPDPVFDAGNLLPMNFNQYSSDDPNVLVRIINDNKGNKNVKFYIFPTQTTKNKYFWSKKAQTAFVEALHKHAHGIDDLILTSIVTWHKKEEDVGTLGESYDLKDMSFESLRNYARNPANINALVSKLYVLLDKAKDDIEVETKVVLPIFDPFCAVCAAHCIEGSFSKVPGSGKLVALPVFVVTNTETTAKEQAEGIKVSPFDRPRFVDPQGYTNCFVVTWGSAGSTPETLKYAAGVDGVVYITELFSSFTGDTSKGKRSVNRILIVQDYYDYDNKMSVWYIVHAFNAKVIELYSVTKPVADKKVMRAMRDSKSAFNFAGGFPQALKPSALSLEAQGEWNSRDGPTYPVGSPVFTTTNFQPGHTKVDGAPLTLKMFKDALKMTEERRAESEAESEQIAYTWYKFIDHMFSIGRAGSDQVTWAVTNGGFTSRHGINPALHTIIEDWYTCVPKKYALDIGSKLERGHDKTLTRTDRVIIK